MASHKASIDSISSWKKAKKVSVEATSAASIQQWTVLTYVIGRFIQKKNVRFFQWQINERHASLLPSTQVAHGNFVGMPLQSILSKTIADGLIVLPWVLITEVFHRSLVHGKFVHKVLIVNSHSEKEQTMISSQVNRNPSSQSVRDTFLP